MEWKTAAEWNEKLHLAPPVREDGVAPIHSYFIGRDDTVVAWITNPDETWFWLQFDDEPPHGPFPHVASAKLACEIHCKKLNF